MRIVFLLVLLMTVPSVLRAQEISDRKGTKAMFFGISGSRIGFDIGEKYWLSNNVAINGRLDYFISRSNGNEHITQIPSGGSTSGGDTHTRYYEYQLSTGINRYWKSGPWSPYLGGQIRTSRSSSKNKFDSNDLSTLSSYSNQTDTTNYGLDAVVGAEFWVSQSISLAAEYFYGATYGVSKTKGTSAFSAASNLTKGNDRGYDIGNSGSTIMLNIYF